MERARIVNRGGAGSVTMHSYPEEPQQTAAVYFALPPNISPHFMCEVFIHLEGLHYVEPKQILSRSCVVPSSTVPSNASHMSNRFATHFCFLRHLSKIWPVIERALFTPPQADEEFRVLIGLNPGPPPRADIFITEFVKAFWSCLSLSCLP